MLKLINLKKLTAKTLIGILVAGSFITQAGTKTASAVQCDNNGHGNNGDITITAFGKEILLTDFDPSNPGDGDKIEREIKDSNPGLTEAEVANAKAIILGGNYDYEHRPREGSDCESDNAAGIVVSIEDPTIQSSQLPNVDEYYTVDFDDQSTGTSGFSRTNGTTTYAYSSNLEVKTANQWGGAGGSKFITQEAIEEIRSYTIDINEDQKYFGFWWSAGDPYNKITFKKDGTKVAEFKTEDLVSFIQSSGVSNTDDYYGNPAYSGSNTGHLNEPFSFVNVFFKKGSYDEIVVATLTAGGSAFESDNHTFSAEDQDPRGKILPNATTSAAINDTITTDEDSPVTANILANDVNPNNDISLTNVTINGIEQSIGSEITLASGALLRVESNGDTTYNPNNRFENLTPADSRSDQFTYSIVDADGNTDTADVTMEIKGVGDAPVAADDVATTDEDTTTQINVLGNDNDPDTSRDQLVVSQIKGENVSAGSTVTLTSGASITLNVDGTLTYDPRNSSTLNSLNDGDTEDEVFSYTVSDEYGNNDTGNVTVTVDGVTDTYAD